MPLFRRKRDHADDDRPVDMEERSPQLGIKCKDLAVVKQLKDHGADLSQPRHVLYWLYVPSREAGAAAAAEIATHGLQAEVREPLPDYPGQWCVASEGHGIVLDADTIRAHGDLFDALAAKHGGEYDGWEASV